MEFTHLSFKYAPLSCLLCVHINLGSHFLDCSAFFHPIHRACYPVLRAPLL